MSDLHNWDAAETFRSREIAALIVGVDPLDPQAALWKAEPVLERIREGYRIGRNFVSHTMTKEHFTFMRTAWKEGLVSVLVSYFPIMQQEAWPGDQDRPFVFPRRVAGPEGEFDEQHFDRAEIHRWLSAVGIKSIYQFDLKQPDAAQTAPVAGDSASGGVEPGKAVPVPVERGLLTKDIAACFGDCYYSADNWPRRLSGTAWLKPARIRRGAAGGASAVWNPLTLAQLLHSKTKGDSAKEKLMKILNSRFTRNLTLGPWRDAFNEYFATHCATD